MKIKVNQETQEHFNSLCESIRLEYFSEVPSGKYELQRMGKLSAFTPKNNGYTIRMNIRFIFVNSQRQLKKRIKHEFIHVELWSKGLPYCHRKARSAFNKRAKELRLGEGDRYEVSTVRFYCPQCKKAGKLTTLNRISTKLKPVLGFCDVCSQHVFFKSTKKRIKTLKKEIES